MSCLEISQAGKPERGIAGAFLGHRRILSSVSKFSYTPKNLLAFNSTVSCQNSHQQQPGVDNTTDHKTPLLSAGKAPLARSVALTFPPPLISQKGKLRHRQTWATCSGFHCTSVLEPGEELMHSAMNFSVLFLPQLEGMFTPCSLSSRLTGSLRIFPGLPAPIPPFPPQLTVHIFPEFSACFSSGSGVLPNASHSLGSRASHS